MNMVVKLFMERWGVVWLEIWWEWGRMKIVRGEWERLLMIVFENLNEIVDYDFIRY